MPRCRENRLQSVWGHSASSGDRKQTFMTPLGLDFYHVPLASRLLLIVFILGQCLFSLVVPLRDRKWNFVCLLQWWTMQTPVYWRLLKPIAMWTARQMLASVALLFSLQPCKKMKTQFIALFTVSYFSNIWLTVMTRAALFPTMAGRLQQIEHLTDEDNLSAYGLHIVLPQRWTLWLSKGFPKWTVSACITMPTWPRASSSHWGTGTSPANDFLSARPFPAPCLSSAWPTSAVLDFPVTDA